VAGILKCRHTKEQIKTAGNSLAPADGLRRGIFAHQGKNGGAF